MDSRCMCFSSCGSRAYLHCSMWGLGPGIKPVSLAMAGRFFTTGLPGKSYSYYFYVIHSRNGTSVSRQSDHQFNYHSLSSVQFSRSVVSDSVTPWIAARQASLSIINSRSSPKLMSMKSVMPSSHFILCRPLFLLPPTPPSIRVF